MIAPWLRDIESIKRGMQGANARVVGVLAPFAESGVSSVARELAAAVASSGKRTLLIDLSQPVAETDNWGDWQGYLRLLDQPYPANVKAARQLRLDVVRALSANRLTRGETDAAALALSEILLHIARLSPALAPEVGVRVAVCGHRLLLEVSHDGPHREEISRLLDGELNEVALNPEHPELGMALARVSAGPWKAGKQPGAPLRATMPLAEMVAGAQAADVTSRGETPYETQSPDGLFDRLVATPRAATRMRFNNVDQIRDLLGVELSVYEAVIVDLPPLIEPKGARLSPLAAAAACDLTLLVVISGQISKDDLGRATALLKASGITIGGLVLNDVHNPTLGEEMAREARRLGGIAPRFSEWLARLALENRFLNRLA